MPQPPPPTPDEIRRRLTPEARAALLKPVYAAARRLPEARAAARRAGVPLTVAELRTVPPVADAENAAPFYRKLAPLARRDEKALPKGWERALKQGYAPAELKAAREAVARSGEVMRLADAATDRPRCDFARDWSKGMNAVTFPEFAAMRHAARLYALRAMLACESGDYAAAARDMERGAILARHSGADPTVITYLVRCAILQIAHGPFVALLRKFGGDAKALAALARAQTRFEGLTDPRPYLRGEAALLLPTLEGIRRGKPGSLELSPEDAGDAGSDLSVYVRTPEEQRALADACEARVLEFWADVFTHLNRPGSTLRQWTQTLTARGSEDDRRVREPGLDLSYSVSAIMAPVFGGVGRRGQQAETSVRLRRAALLALGVRQRTGAFPPFLATIPQDPFSDRPLLYRPEGKGLLLYGVGANGKDDGGSDDPDPDPEREGFRKDITLRLPG